MFYLEILIKNLKIKTKLLILINVEKFITIYQCIVLLLLFFQLTST